MTKFDLTIFGKKFSVSKWGFIAVMLIAWVPYLYCCVAGFWRFGENYLGSGALALTAAFMLFVSITVDGVRYAVLPESKWANFLNTGMMWAALFYYLFTVFWQ